jgi:hypothetical protein
LENIERRQARSQGGASECSEPTIILDEPTRNSQNIKAQHAEKPAARQQQYKSSTTAVQQQYNSSTTAVQQQYNSSTTAVQQQYNTLPQNLLVALAEQLCLETKHSSHFQKCIYVLGVCAVL